MCETLLSKTRQLVALLFVLWQIRQSRSSLRELPISCSQSHTRTRTRLWHNVFELNTIITDFFSRVRAPDNGSRLYRKFGKSCDREKRQRNFRWQSRFTKFVKKRIVVSAELWLFWNGSKWHSTVHEKSGDYLDVGG